MVYRILSVLAVGLIVLGAVIGAQWYMAWRADNGASLRSSGAIPPQMRPPGPMAAAAWQQKKGPPKPIVDFGPQANKPYTPAEALSTLVQARAARKQHPQAMENVSSWYTFLADQAFTQAKDNAEHCAKLQTWSEEQPDSPVPLIALARAEMNQAWRSRGNGAADTVTEEGQKRFLDQMSKARALLERAIGLGPLDGAAHAALLAVARAEGWPLEKTRAVFDAGCKIDPSYVDLYSAMAEYLLPCWHGKDGDIERFAAEAVKSLPGDDGLDAYLHIAYTVNQYDSNLLFWGRFDRQLLVRAAEVGIKRYPHTRNLAPFTALCTVIAQDAAAAQRIRPAIFHKDAPRVWVWDNVSDEFFEWCSAQDVKTGRCQWLFGAPLCFGPVVFEPGKQAVWCATGLSANAITLWDLPTSTVKQALWAGGSQIDRFVVDSSRQWVAGTLGGTKGRGWMLWDLDRPDEPLTHETDDGCRAIAIHPRRPEVVWAAGKNVRSLDVTTQKERLAIELTRHVEALQLSPDGTRLAVLAGDISVWDADSGKKLYELPPDRTPANGPIACEKLLDLDEQGRAWAIARVADSSPIRRQIVRFQSDGKQWDVIAKNVNENKIQPLSATLSPDRRLLAVLTSLKGAGDMPAIEIWDLTAGKIKTILSGQSAPISSLAFSTDGSALASASQPGGAVRIWRIEGP
jgi:WD40 repeat protein